MTQTQYPWSDWNVMTRFQYMTRYDEGYYDRYDLEERHIGGKHEYRERRRGELEKAE